MMTASLTHVILTRFNLATPGRESALRNQPDWLARRFTLFEEICLPSMAAQSSKNFHWIIYFDEHTPDSFRERIDTLRQTVPFTPYFTDLFQADGWVRSLEEVIPARSARLLSTRLDNDDALARDYVERVQSEAERHAGSLPVSLNFQNGFIRTDDSLYAIQHSRNAFFSRLCRWEPGMVVANGIQHMDLERHGPVVQIDGPGAWLQVVHGQNVSNKVRGWRIPLSKCHDRFPSSCLSGIGEGKTVPILLENAIRSPLRAARDLAIDVVRRRV